ADAGIVISASHNPVEFNGIKIFNSEGYKLADAIEDEIESYIFEKKGEIKLKTHGEIGTAGRSPKALEDYVEHVVSCVEGDLEGIRAVIDCANGAAYKSAREIFARLKVDAHYIGVSPDGVNINDGVGSTHLEKLRGSVLERGADIGIAFDGDADRCLAVDERGSLIDGDMIIAALARYFKEQGRLKNDACVVTVMTNLGFMDFCKQNGIRAVRTAVGDRYVLEELLRSGCVLGGEQSGHVIMTDYCTTGDGEATAALLLQILKQSGKRASELFSEIKRYPQLMINLPVSAEGKARFKEDEELQGFIEAQQQELFDTGRVLVRVSGTEPLIRIMVEGRDEEKIKTAAREIEQRLKERLG
ncbi:MAG: phosphoglucosamine mutase, partial [Oscillospiraceae bacterium]|nr:phosphoglucosamine mutase [Oscillospiraceae bacterium]